MDNFTHCSIGLILFAAAATAAPQSLGSEKESTVMIVEFERGAPMIGLPAGCATEENPEGDICLAELYEGPATVVRHLSGPKAERKSVVRLQAHARRWSAGTRMLVETRPFIQKGQERHFAIWWRLEEEDGSVCMSHEELKIWPDGPLRRVFAGGKYRRFQARGYDEPQDFRCVR